jgi:conjugal transfer/entry exclusion protein
MISPKDLSRIKNELQKLFPEAQDIKTEHETLDKKENAYYESFYLYLNKGTKIALKFSKDYLEQHNFDEFSKHLQRNIYYVMKSNINKSIYLLKNFEIEVEETGYA